jgi:general secretion pathway protein D
MALMPPPSEEALVLPELPPEPEAAEEVTLSPQATGLVLFEETEDEKYIILNFENTNIRTIIDTFSEILDINYILTPGISGTVTIQSYHKFPVSNLYQIFQSVLEINGLTAIKEDSFYRIVPLDTARQQPLDIKSGMDVEIRLDGSFVTQLVPLQYVRATELANIFKNLMPRGTDLIIYEPANMLIVTALPPTLVKFMKLIAALDVPETEAEAIRAFVYHVENGEAKKLADILKTLYPPEKKGVTPATAPTPAPARALPGARRPATAPTFTATAEALPGVIGDITVTAYEDINALIIKCTPKSYIALLEVLKKIDIPVKQVVIEVLIAEITLTDSTDFGVQWLMDSGATTAGFTTSSTPLTGFTFDPPVPKFASLISGTIDRTFLQSFITALSGESRINVLASPQILALDNKEAEIKIGDEVPTATGLTQQPATGGGTTLVSSGQIQYKTVGTILKVTPHITETGNVSMKLVVEQSGIGTDVTLGSGTFPSFSTRKATTSAVVSTGRTLFIGGLISEDNNLSRSGVPGLSKIPILGYLFGTTDHRITKRELLVMVTPHVIGNQKEADEITRDFQNRVRTIKKRLEKLDAKGKNVFLPEQKEVADITEEETELVTEEDIEKAVDEAIEEAAEEAPMELPEVPE